jgi:hypothetical protein
LPDIQKSGAISIGTHYQYPLGAGYRFVASIKVPGDEN